MLELAPACRTLRRERRWTPQRRYRRRLGAPSPPRRLLLSPLLAAYRGAAGELARRLSEEGPFFPDLPAGREGARWRAGR